MEDRVRIYELARRMNLSNQEVINALRELGYDIKSHSSTVDSQAVGLFIAHLGKKKQQSGEPAKPAGKSAKSGGAATKTSSSPVSQPVKPRVLSRYRPTPPPLQEPSQEQSPAATGEGGSTVTDIAPPAAARPGEQATRTTAAGPAQPQMPLQAGRPVAPPVAEDTLAADAKELASQTKPAETKDSPAPPAKPAEKDGEPELEDIAQPGGEPEPEPEVAAEEVSPADESSAKQPSGPGMRPMQPSVPIRIAAPSFRATPPRPPKHRQGPQERHTQQKREEKAKPAAVTVEVPRMLALHSNLTVKELSDLMAISETEIIKRLFIKGFMRTVNQVVELELARDLAAEMGYEIQSLEEIQAQEKEKQELEKLEQMDAVSDDEKAHLVPRPPVVTIMGHVDHGKTSLLDAIRQTKFLLTDAEAGGITQHIGAYHVEVTGEDGTLRQIVFLDTPGHEAFTAMRARGAKSTDIAILVVAADDGVMPQTAEAIDHAQAAGVPIIVAVNKIDKAGADPDRVLTQLMEHGLVPERFGGDTVTVAVSAKKRTGLDELLEMILLVADMQDLRANPDRQAVGTIIEAELHRGKGSVATALVQNGTLRMGDIIVAGSVFGRVRALLDDRGQQVRAAGPSMPVEVLGLPEVPLAGDRFEVVDDLQTAKHLAEQRRLAESERRTHRVTLESLHDLLEQGEVKDLNIIIKADVQGTAEAIADQVRKLSTKEVQVRVLRAATGDISETDVNLAASSNAIIIGFNVNPDPNAARAAEVAGTDIHTYNIIYEIIDNLELAIQGLLTPIKEEVHLGTAEVRQVFKLGKNQVIAGCYVTSGKIQRGAIARVHRGTTQIYDGKVETLRRFKDDVREVATNFECGIGFEKFNDIEEGDIISVFVIQETKRTISR